MLVRRSFRRCGPVESRPSRPVQKKERRLRTYRLLQVLVRQDQIRYGEKLCSLSTQLQGSRAIRFMSRGACVDTLMCVLLVMAMESALNRLRNGVLMTPGRDLCRGVTRPELP